MSLINGGYVIGQTLYELFANTVDRHPANIAVECGPRAVSYADLDRLTDRVAAVLQQVAPASPEAGGNRIGLAASRSVEAYAGVLGILRSGAAMVALNPHTTVHRNLAIVEQAGLDVVLADAAAAHQVDALRADGVHVIDLREAVERPAPRLSPFLPPPPESVAYIGFTSGSTGRPKGVPISHRNATQFILDSLDRYGFTEDSRVGQVFELSFDPGINEVFSSWAAGARVCVVSASDVLFPASYVAEQRLTHLLVLPSIVSFAARDGQLTPHSLPTLRQILLGGETVSVRHAEICAAAAPDAVINNCYGPTELAILCANYVLPRHRSDWPSTSNSSVPIGRIYEHLEWVLLDGRFRPADDGELCVRGPQRFRGYLDPADNAGRFVRLTESGAPRVLDADTPIEESDWYRTGDRVAARGGLLVHLGRIDDQVKIDGSRVEPGEVEAVLRGVTGVLDVAVVPVEVDGSLELHAYYTGEPEEPDALAMAASRLPVYLRPRAYHHRQQLPLLVNGKIDRSRLALVARGEVRP